MFKFDIRNKKNSFPFSNSVWERDSENVIFIKMLWFCVLMWTLKKRRNCQFTVWAINPVFQQEKYLHFLMLSFTMLQNKMHLLLYASTMSKMTTKIIEFVYTATYIYRNNPMLFRLYVKSKCRQTFFRVDPSVN